MRSLIILLYAAALLFVACRKESAAPPPAQQKAQPASATIVAEPPKDLSGETINLKIPVEVEKRVALDCKAGSSVESGLVSEPKTEFRAKETIHLMMHLRDAPPGLAVRVAAFDEKGKEVASEQKPAEGAEILTLRLGTLKPGKYTLRGYWGGNEACERKIEVKK